jgi:hypothetical protein
MTDFKASTPVTAVSLPTGTNTRDVVFKSLWTFLQVGVPVALVVLADLPYQWAVAAVAVLTPLSAWLRQQQGATPPTLPAEGPIGGTLPEVLTGP